MVLELWVLEKANGNKMVRLGIAVWSNEVEEYDGIWTPRDGTNPSIFGSNV